MTRKYHDPARELAGDWRLLLLVLPGLIVQTAHPVIGPAVGQQSAYARDPFGRLLRSLFPVLALVLMDDDEAAELGRDLRAMHKKIAGTDHRGRAYHAWDPHAAFTVLATGLEASVQVAQLYGRPLTEDEREQVFLAWRRAGQHFGIPERAMPSTLAEYDVWWTDLIDNKLEMDVPTTESVLGIIRRPAVAPPLVPDVAWQLLAPTLGHFAMLTTVAALPLHLRERLDLKWTARHELEFAMVATTVRGIDQILPAPVRNLCGVIVQRRTNEMRAYAKTGAKLGISPHLAAEQATTSHANTGS